MGIVAFVLARCLLLWCKEHLPLLRGLWIILLFFFGSKQSWEDHTAEVYKVEQRVAFARRIHVWFLSRVVPECFYTSSTLHPLIFSSQRGSSVAAHRCSLHTPQLGEHLLSMLSLSSLCWEVTSLLCMIHPSASDRWWLLYTFGFTLFEFWISMS